MTLHHLREDYTAGEPLRRRDLAAEPVTQFRRWFDTACESEIYLPDAMTLATVDEAGRPNARIVVLRGVDERGFTFYSGGESRKGKELAATPQAALVFHWNRLERQVRVRGPIHDVPREEAEAYFAKRPRASCIAAWASPQSETIPDRDHLEARAREMEERFRDRDVPAPAAWRGYRVVPEEVEFWQGRESRLHDRFVYRRESETWRLSRLAP